MDDASDSPNKRNCTISIHCAEYHRAGVRGVSLFVPMLPCCCDGGTPTPATECPGEIPCPTKTVRVSITADPIACDPVESVDCTECTEFCGGSVDACCPDTIPLMVPRATFTTGLSQAIAAHAWHAYAVRMVDQDGCHLVSTTSCGSEIIPFTEQYSAVAVAELDCGTYGAGFGSCTGTPTTIYHPSESAFNANMGMKIILTGCCCGDCECDTPNKCSFVDVNIEARWAIPLDLKLFGYAQGPPWYCNCEIYDEFGNVIGTYGLDYPYGGTFATDFVHIQYASVRFETTIYDDQTDCGLAPGPYTISYAALSNQPGGILMDGFGYNHVIMECGTPGYLEHTTPPPDCDSITTCSKGELKAAGWSISVSVDA